MSITASLYARRKGWTLERARVDVRHRPAAGTGRPRIEVRLDLTGSLDGEQEARVRAIARRCPVHRMLAESAEIVEV